MNELSLEGLVEKGEVPCNDSPEAYEKFHKVWSLVIYTKTSEAKL